MRIPQAQAMTQDHVIGQDQVGDERQARTRALQTTNALLKRHAAMEVEDSLHAQWLGDRLAEVVSSDVTEVQRHNDAAVAIRSRRPEYQEVAHRKALARFVDELIACGGGEGESHRELTQFFDGMQRRYHTYRQDVASGMVPLSDHDICEMEQGLDRRKTAS